MNRANSGGAAWSGFASGVMTLGLALAIGCDWSAAPKPLPVPVKAPVTSAAATGSSAATVDAKSTTAESGQPASSPVTDAAASAAPQVPYAAAASASPAPAAPPPPTFATERILLLPPGNPVIVEIQFSIDGRPHTDALARLVADVLAVADTDGDGRPTWKEVTESKRFKYGQYGNVAITGDNQYKQVKEMYDSNRDDVVDAAELPRFLTRNAGSARAFSVRGLADFRRTGRDSPLWTLIDADDDGVITAAERAAAPGRLLSRDSDDDEIVLPGDVSARLPADRGMMTTRRRGSEVVVRLLGPYADWDSVKGALESAYAGSRSIRADSFPLTPELFTQLDANGDGRVLKNEFAALNTVPPHVVLAVNFGRAEPPAEKERPPADKVEPPKSEGAAETTEAASAEDDKPASDQPASESSDETPPAPPPVPTIRLVSIAPQLADASAGASELPGRITFRVGGLPMTFYLNDTVPGGDFAAQAKQLLMGLDADKNGYLEEKEAPANLAGQLGQFAAVDLDENGKVYADEIAEFLQQQQAGLRAQIHLLAADREDALFAALDTDYDQRLDAREIESVPNRLAELDASGDGELSGDEVPAMLLVGLARGNLENLEGLFTPPPVIARAPAEGTPRWFSSMDANGDGAISRREFLGPAEAFAALDTGGDGLVDAAEAKAVKQDDVAAPASGN